MEEFMDKIELLKSRRAALLDCGRDIREKIASLTDDKSFVELDAYSFSHNDFYGEDAQGEGVGRFDRPPSAGSALRRDLPAHQPRTVPAGAGLRLHAALRRRLVGRSLRPRSAGG